MKVNREFVRKVVLFGIISLSLFISACGLRLPTGTPRPTELPTYIPTPVATETVLPLPTSTSVPPTELPQVTDPPMTQPPTPTQEIRAGIQIVVEMHCSINLCSASLWLVHCLHANPYIIIEPSGVRIDQTIKAGFDECVGGLAVDNFAFSIHS